MKKIGLLLISLILSSIGCSKDSSDETPSTPSYTLTVNQSEGGTVNSSGGSYQRGTELSISATPNQGYVFTGWSDGSTENPRLIVMTQNRTLTPSFSVACVFNSPSIDLTNSSYNLFDIKFPLASNGEINYDMSFWLGEGWEYGFGGAFVDYNNDGYLDIIGYRNDYNNYVDYPQGYTGYERKQLIRFFTGGCNGNYTSDIQNDNKFYGLVHGRKLLMGDFNNDNYVDFFLIGHGYDKQPFPGEFNKSLMSNGNGGYIENNYTDLVSFYHGGASGDYDNDGDLDVFVIEAGGGKSALFENVNGVFLPNIASIDQNLMAGMFNAELYDINKDGFLDIICGGHDWTHGNTDSYDNPPLIIYGDGTDYVGNQTLRLPGSSVSGQGVVTDFNFYDLNGDNIEEIILTRTGDNQTDPSNFYNGWSIQILEKTGTMYVDRTENFIDNSSNSSGSWIRWGHFSDKDNDGKVEFFNTAYPDSQDYLEWELNGGMLIKQ